MKTKNFTLDFFDLGETIEGLTHGDTWNGWECPLFTFDNVEKIIKRFGNRSLIKYDNQKDAFIWGYHDSDEIEEFEATTIDGKKYYPIGAYSWCWYTE